MLRFTSLFEDLLTLEKARKKVDLHTLASDMDTSLGPWPKEMGSRADAVEHVLKFGRSQSLQLKEAASGTPEHKAYSFVRDARSHAAGAKHLKEGSKKQAFGADTLEGPIDKDHIDHYVHAWANHHHTLENKSSAASTDEDTGHLISGLGGRAAQTRSLVVTRRMNHMKRAGAKDLIATPDDLDTLHTGADRAIQAGKVPVQDANRYHVMRATLKHAESSQRAEFPDVPFQPSYASMDTGALRAMKTGLDHLHETGFSGSRERLAPTVVSALSSHEAHPFVSISRKNHQVTAFPYPALHKIGSPHQTGQLEALSRHHKNLDTARNPSKKVAPAAKKPAEPKPPELPSSYAEYRARQQNGEIFESSINTKMERLRYESRLTKALVAHSLVKSIRTRRRKAS